MATNPDVSALLQAGIEAAKRGDRAAASEILQQVVDLDERNEQAWLWLSGVVDDPADTRVCLENVLEINPNSARAIAGLQWLDKQQGVQGGYAAPSSAASARPSAADATPMAGDNGTSAFAVSNAASFFPTESASISASAPTSLANETAAASPFGQPSPFEQPMAASPFGQAAPASPFEQAPASPFGQAAAPASPFGQAAASPFSQPTTNGSSSTQYLPFGQTAPPPTPVAPPAPEPEPIAPVVEEPPNPFLQRRPASGGLAGRLGGVTQTGGDDLANLRSSLFGGGGAPSTDTPSGGNKRNEGGFSPAATSVRNDSGFSPSTANPFAESNGSAAAVVSPFASTDSPFAANGNGRTAFGLENGFAAASPEDEANPFASMSSGGFAAAPSSNGFAPADAGDNGNPFGISSDLQPFSLQDMQEPSAGGNGFMGGNYAMPGAEDGESSGFGSGTPFGAPLDVHPPVFAPRPATPEPPAPERPRGLAGRAGLSDLMNAGISDPFGPPTGMGATEVPRPSSPALISRPPLPGGARSTPPDVVTFPCPNCRKLVPENALSCPQCSFQFYARCPNCGEYVDTTIPSSPRGDHCPNCGIIINLMELGRGSAGTSSASAPTEAANIRPRSNLKGEEGMSLMMPVKGLVEPATTKRRRPSLSQIFAFLIIIAIIAFLFWAKDNLPIKAAESTTSGQAVPMVVLAQGDPPGYGLNFATNNYHYSLGSTQAVFAAGERLYV